MTESGARHIAYHELREQLERPGCALCHLAARAAARYLETLDGEALLDPEIRIGLRNSLGFCATHAHALDATAHRLTVAILYEDFLRCAGEELDARTRSRRSRRSRAPCPACRAAERSEEEYTSVLAASLGDTAIWTAYERSSGLCLRHTLDLCRRLKDPERCRVVAVERARLERLRAELAEVIRKHDYRFRDEPWGEEKHAPSRAVACLAGERPNGAA